MVPPKNRYELDEVFNLLLQNFSKSEIRKRLNISSSALSNHLRRLEEFGCIKRRGKYVIDIISREIPSSQYTPRVTKNKVHIKLNKRGHAYNFKVVFPSEKNLIEKTKVKHEYKVKNLEKLKFGSLKLIKDKNSIWINKESLTIYSNNSYYSQNALHAKFRALREIDNLIVYLKDRFGFTGIYGIEIFREHYGLIFNKFAEWIIKSGRKLYVKEKGNKTILWVDKSRKDDIGLNEFETEDPLRANSADELFKSHERTDWKVTPEATLKLFNKAGELIKKNAENASFHMENMRTHIKAVQDLGKGVGKQNEIFERMAIVLEKLEGGK